jgi:Zn-dependent metalloprotease
MTGYRNPLHCVLPPFILKLGGRAWERAGRIWYEALQHSALRPRSTFSRFGGITVRVAERIYGKGSAEIKAVHGGWEEVGVATPKP